MLDEGIQGGKTSSRKTSHLNAASVLVGTYRKVNASWIENAQLYNAPVSKGQDTTQFESFDHIILFAKKLDPKAYQVKFLGIKTRDWLIKTGYKVAAGSHGENYAVYKLIDHVNPNYLLCNQRVKVTVYTSKWNGFVDRSFYEKLLPPCNNKTTNDLFAFLKRYLFDSKATQISSSQMQFWEITGEDVKLDVPFPGPRNPKFTFIDLFAGIGGFRLAMQASGGQCVYSSEFDKYAQETYRRNFGEVPFGDITKKETKDAIPEKFDIVCAGFPCQAFSLAGKRKGFDDNYKGMCRGTLFKEVVEICEKHKPKAVFCENVKGLLNHDKGNTLKVIKGSFEQIGYKFFVGVLNSKDFGVPQHRERVYMVAFRNDYAPDKFDFPKPTGEAITLADIRQGSQPGDPPVTGRYYLSDVYLETLRRHRQRHEKAGHGFGYVIRKWDGISGAIVCGGMGRETNLVQEDCKKTPKGIVPETHIKGVINKEGIRKMTPLEWSRLQGFPYGFKLELSDVHLYKQFGNSVSVPVIRAIGRKIINRLAMCDREKKKRV